MNSNFLTDISRSHRRSSEYRSRYWRAAVNLGYRWLPYSGLQLAVGDSVKYGLAVALCRRGRFGFLLETFGTRYHAEDPVLEVPHPVEL